MLWLAIGIWLSACHAPPVVMDTSGGTDFRSLERTQTDALLWPADMPLDTLAPGSRVAIIECTIEFVTIRQTMPTKRQALFGGPISPLAAAIDLSGTLRHRTEYPSKYLNELPNDIYALLVDQLESQGVRVIDPSICTAALERHQLISAEEARSDITRFMTPFSTDTGRINEFTAHAADPLPVINRKMTEELRHQMYALRQDLDVDALLRLRLRIGVYRECVCVEQGSLLTIGTHNDIHNSISRRSLIAAEPAAVEDEYSIVLGRASIVNWMMFRQQLLTLAREYIRAGIQHNELRLPSSRHHQSASAQ